MTHIDGVKKLKSKLSKQVRFFRTALWQALFLDISAVEGASKVAENFKDQF